MNVLHTETRLSTVGVFMCAYFYWLLRVLYAFLFVGREGTQFISYGGMLAHGCQAEY